MAVETNLPDSSDYDAIIFAVSHKEFQNISMKDWVSNIRTLLFDANNVLTQNQVSEIKNSKLNYMSIGRG